jgi:hypothetical protein
MIERVRLDLKRRLLDQSIDDLPPLKQMTPFLRSTRWPKYCNDFVPTSLLNVHVFSSIKLFQIDGADEIPIQLNHLPFILPLIERYMDQLDHVIYDVSYETRRIVMSNG